MFSSFMKSFLAVLRPTIIISAFGIIYKEDEVEEDEEIEDEVEEDEMGEIEDEVGEIEDEAVEDEDM